MAKAGDVSHKEGHAFTEQELQRLRGRQHRLGDVLCAGRGEKAGKQDEYRTFIAADHPSGREKMTGKHGEYTAFITEDHPSARG